MTPVAAIARRTSMPSPRIKLNVDVLRNPAWVCFVWFGLTAGASLLAVPAIFSAESATRAVSLDVARSVFELLGKAELILLVMLLTLVRVTDQAGRLWAWCAVLALIMIAQVAWLIPELSARTDSILGGVEPPPSIAHAAYSISGLVKLACLFILGVMTSKGRPSG